MKSMIIIPTYNEKDNIEKLKNKIIERTIGFRLRSLAIQGETK